MRDCWPGETGVAGGRLGGGIGTEEGLATDLD